MDIFTDEITKRKLQKHYFFFSNTTQKEEIEKIIKEKIFDKEIKEIKIFDYGYYKDAVAFIYLED